MNTRLSHGVSKGWFNTWFSRRDREAYLWAKHVKPGTIINSFDSFNHEVSEVNLLWSSPNHWGRMLSPKTYRKHGWKPDEYHTGRGIGGRFLYDVEFKSTDGYSHFISESGCIVPGYSYEDMIRVHGIEILTWMRDQGILDAAWTHIRSATPEEREEIQKLSEQFPVESEYWPDLNYPPLASYKKRRGRLAR